uniref:DNA-directed RNA polymerase subunit alpha n=1 Tax=Fusochloris perforata TaxID=106203 RepID=A0A097KPT0_9CHLO|nr:alpha subunit of RNA polymerase [Fusochloris perforata]AIT95204.1 alpha subunit of RNA polymerase [Fusochloris perforata]
MQQPSLSCIYSRVEDDNSLYGRFLIGPFAVGQGITLANALRRSLLSELSGLAIVAVEIDGVTHEYSSIQGVRDSVLDILLNIKQIRFTTNLQVNEPQIAYLQIKGPGIVVAKDIKLPNCIQCINPEQYIASLSFDGILRIKFYICRGKNFTATHPNFLGPFIPLEQNNHELAVRQPAAEQPVALRPVTMLPVAKQSIESLPATSSPAVSLPAAPVLDNIYQVIKKKLNKKTVSTRVRSLRKNTTFNEKTPEIYVFSEGLQPAINPSKEGNLLPPAQQEYKSLIRKTSEFRESINPNNELLEYNTYPLKKVKETSKKTKLKPLNYSAKEQILPYRKEEQFFTNDPSPIQFDDFSKNQKRILLPINAVFAPVNKVNFLLETDDELKESRDRIILEVWTNGSIHPREAIHYAAQAFMDVLSPFQEAQKFKQLFPSFKRVFHKSLNKLETDLKKSSRLVKKQNIASLDIANLQLSLRSYTCLKRAGIETVGELLQLSSNDLLLLQNFGERSLEELKVTLNQIGLFLLPTKKENMNNEIISR